MKRLAIALTLVLLVGTAWLVLRERRTIIDSSMPIADQQRVLGNGNMQSNRLRVLVAPYDPVRGANHALVTLVQFCDFRTPACKRTARSLFEAVLTYPNEARVVFKALPSENDAEAKLAAQATLAANEQGRFWQLHDSLFANPGRLDRQSLEVAAQGVGLDMAKLRGRLDAPELIARLAETSEQAQGLGVTETPALFMNGVRLDDASEPFVHLKLRIEAELKLVRALMQEEDLESSQIYSALLRDARPHAFPRRTSVNTTK